MICRARNIWIPQNIDWKIDVNKTVIILCFGSIVHVYVLKYRTATKLLIYFPYTDYYNLRIFLVGGICFTCNQPCVLCWFQVVSVKEKDLTAAFRCIFFLLKENVAFRKYNAMLDLCAELGVIPSTRNLPGNANMRSERMKAELIQTLGKLENINSVGQL